MYSLRCVFDPRIPASLMECEDFACLGAITTKKREEWPVATQANDSGTGRWTYINSRCDFERKMSEKFN